MKKNLVLTVLTVLLFVSCLPIHIDPPPLRLYSARWILSNTAYADQCFPDSTQMIILYQDSSWVSNFSFFMDEDSSRSDSLRGKWDTNCQMVYYDSWYYTITLFCDDLGRSWKVQISDSDNGKTMRWETAQYDGNQMKYVWSYAGGAHLPPDEQEDKK